MDRWSEDDLGPRSRAGNVARLGIGGFVKSDTGYGATATTSAPQIEVVASKRVQKRAAEVQQQVPSGQPAAPSWAGRPPPHSLLKVLKDGAVLQEVPLTKAATLFGRGATADVVCDHASLSRQHAQLCFQPATQSWLVLDLGSTHGTFADNRPVVKGKPVELPAGKLLRFGASTRQYMVHAGSRKRPLDGTATEPGSVAELAKAPRVHFADRQAGDDARELEQIIGYSDGRSFAVNVGPTASDAALKGQFEGLVARPTSLEASIADKNADQVDGIQHNKPKLSLNARQEEKRQRRVQPLLPQTSAGLYDALPSPASG